MVSATELSGPRRHVLGGGNQAHQRGGQRLRQLVVRPVPVQPQILQHAIERGLAVQADHEIALRLGYIAPRSDRLAALGHARDQADFRAEGHPGQTAGEYPIRHVYRTVARRRQPAEQIPGGRARAQLVDQLLHVGRGAFGMDQRGMGHEPGRCGRQRLQAREQSERFARQRREHQHQGRLVDVFDAAGGHAHTDRADPSHAGEAQPQLIEDRLGRRRVIVAQITPAQRERGGITLLRGTRGDLCLKLPLAMGQGHTPIGVGGMSLHK